MEAGPLANGAAIGMLAARSGIIVNSGTLGLQSGITVNSDTWCAEVVEAAQ